LLSCCLLVTKWRLSSADWQGTVSFRSEDMTKFLASQFRNSPNLLRCTIWQNLLSFVFLLLTDSRLLWLTVRCDWKCLKLRYAQHSTDCTVCQTTTSATHSFLPFALPAIHSMHVSYRTTKQLCQFTVQNLRSRPDGERSAQCTADLDGVTFPVHCVATSGTTHFLFWGEKKFLRWWFWGRGGGGRRRWTVQVGRDAVLCIERCYSGLR